MRPPELEFRRADPAPRPTSLKDAPPGDRWSGTRRPSSRALRQSSGSTATKKLLRRQPAPLGIPHPLVAHRADAALQPAHRRHAAQRRRHHVAMFQRRNHARALLRVVPQPVQQFGESPLVRVDAAAPLDPFKTQFMRLARDLLGLGKGAMIAPQVVLIERLQALRPRESRSSPWYPAQSPQPAPRRCPCS